jgi:tetratricopeptide (TPR) repeat protein
MAFRIGRRASNGHSQPPAGSGALQSFPIRVIEMGTAFLQRRWLVYFLATTLAIPFGANKIARAQEDAAAPAADAAAAPAEGQQQFNPQEVLEKAEGALKEGKYQEALEAFNQLARAGESAISQEAFAVRLIGYTGRARAYVGMKEYEAALEDFKLATDMQENYTPALIARGKMFLEIANPDNYPAALADFQKAMKADRANFDAQFGFGKAAVLTGNYQAAITPLNRVLEAQPENAEALRLRGTAYTNTFKPIEGVDDLQKSIRLDPTAYESYLQLGAHYMRNEEYQSAVNQFKKAIEHFKPKDPEDDSPYAQGYLTLASAYVELGKKEKDEAAKKAAFQAAVDQAELLLSKLDEKNPYLAGIRAAALYSRGVAERMLGDLDKAIRTFSEAIEINPDLGEAYFRRGICFHYIGEDNMALTDFVESANINYDDPRANLWEGFTQAKLGNYHEAVRAYGNAISASDRYTPAYLNRGLAYMALGEYDKAIADFTAAIRLEPTNADYYYRRGMAYMALGDFQKAAESLTNAVQRNEKHPAASRALSDALDRLGRAQEANQYRQRANQLAPQQNSR